MNPQLWTQVHLTKRDKLKKKERVRKVLFPKVEQDAESGEEEQKIKPLKLPKDKKKQYKNPNKAIQLMKTRYEADDKHFLAIVECKQSYKMKVVLLNRLEDVIGERQRKLKEIKTLNPAYTELGDSIFHDYNDLREEVWHFIALYNENIE